MANAKLKAAYLEGSILRHILNIATASYVASFVIQLTDLLVIFYVAHVSDSITVSGLSAAMVAFFFAFALNIGSAVAAGSYISRRVIEDDELEIRRKVLNCLLVGMSFGWLGSVMLYFASPLLFDAFSVSEEARRVATSYLHILLPVNGVQAIAMSAAAVMRAVGKPRLAMLATLSGASANLIIDPFLILGLEMGVNGAAIGVWIGRSIQATVAIILLLRLGIIGRTTLVSLMASANWLLRLAVPTTVAASAGPIADATLLWILGPFGDQVRAGVFLVDKIAVFAFGFTVPLASAMGIFVAQNNQGGRNDRAHEALIVFCITAISYVLMWAAILFAARNHIPSVFGITDPAAVGIILQYIPVIGLAWIGMSLLGGSNAFFQNTGRPSYSMYFSWIRATVGMVPCWVAAQLWGSPQLVVIGFALSMCLVSFAGVTLAFRLARQNLAAAGGAVSSVGRA